MERAWRSERSKAERWGANERCERPSGVLKTRLSQVETDQELGHDALQLDVVLWPHVMHYGHA